jgi:hypothetical protein
MRVSGGHTKIQNFDLEDSPAWFQPQADAISTPWMPSKPLYGKNERGVGLDPNPSFE